MHAGKSCLFLPQSVPFLTVRVATKLPADGVKTCKKLVLKRSMYLWDVRLAFLQYQSPACVETSNIFLNGDLRRPRDFLEA